MEIESNTDWLEWPNHPDPADVYFFAQDLLTELARRFEERFFPKPRRLRFAFVTDPNVIAQAVTPYAGQEHRVEFSQELPRRLFESAWGLVDLLSGARADHPSAKALVEAFPDLFPSGVMTTPYELTPQQMLLEVFSATLTWLFGHEAAHLLQRHAAVRSAHLKAGNDVGKDGQRDLIAVGSILSAGSRSPLRGRDALIFHATELAADLEGLSLAMFYRDPTRQGASAEILAPARIYCLVAGSALAFTHFYDLLSKGDLSAEAEGQHPDPTVRLMVLTRNAEELLRQSSVQAVAPWTMDIESVERLLQFAECAVSAAQSIQHGGPPLLPIFSRMLSEQKQVKRYFESLEPVWTDLRPSIVQAYFGPDPRGIMYLARKQ
ncbi:hypothetical protein ACN9MB_11095 [Dyella kyungheensis]|uniref:hypothetical protein n=1 Tax=Dyella kyungheensis TaxID=1242174 RepID=UPI003CF5D501